LHRFIPGCAVRPYAKMLSSTVAITASRIVELPANPASRTRYRAMWAEFQSKRRRLDRYLRPRTDVRRPLRASRLAPAARGRLGADRQREGDVGATPVARIRELYRGEKRWCPSRRISPATLAPDGILVNAVAPGPILTEWARPVLASAGIDVGDPVAAFGVLARGHGMAVDLNRLSPPQEVAAVIAFCASRTNGRHAQNCRHRRGARARGRRPVGARCRGRPDAAWR
jgi:hypothetical protein